MSRHRHRNERGQVSIEWAGVLLLVAIVVAAIFALGLPGRVVPQVEIAICKIFGGDKCEQQIAEKYEPPPCIVEQFDGEVNASVTVFSIKGGGKVKITRTVDSKGKVTETVTATAEAAAKLGLGGDAEVTGGEDDDAGAGGGASAEAELGGKGAVQFGWEFPNQAKADEFHDILLGKVKDIAVGSNPVGWIYQKVTGDTEDRPLPAPNIYAVEGGITGSASASYGPLKGSVSGEGVLGAKHNTKTGETEVYIQGGGKVSAAALVGGTGSADVKMAVVFDKNHKPIRLDIIGTAEGTAAPVLQGRTDLASIMKSVVAEDGKRFQAKYSLDLRDPALQDKVTEFLKDPSQSRAESLKDTVLENSKISLTKYDVDKSGGGVSGDVGVFGVDFGLSAGANGKNAKITDAQYYNPATGQWQQWDSCLKGKN